MNNCCYMLVRCGIKINSVVGTFASYRKCVALHCVAASLH